MSEPVTLAAAKLAARLDSDDTTLDGYVGTCIAAARARAEQVTGRAYVQRTVRTELADWPAADRVLPGYQASACAVTYLDTSGTWVTLDTSLYDLAPLRSGMAIAPTIAAQAWPTLGQRNIGPRVTVTLTVGPADPPATVPDSVKLYIMAHVTAMVDNPSAVAASSLQVSDMFDRLLDDQRLYF